METNICRCENGSIVKYFNLQYLCDESQRWICQFCYYKKKQRQMKPLYANQKAALKKFNKDVQALKIKRINLIMQLHQLFDEFPFQQQNKINYGREISQINTIFVGIINNPLSEIDLQGLEQLLKSLSDVNFNKITEQEIKKFLSIGRGHYQCDNSKIKEILTIMSNLEEIKQSNLFLSLKLIATNQEQSKYFESGIENNVVIDEICIANKNLLYCPSYLNDDPDYYENSNEFDWIILQQRCWIQSMYSYNKKNKFQIFINILPEFMITCKCILVNSILLFQQQVNISNQNKLYMICTKSKKIIRSLIFNKYECLQQYDFRTNQIITMAKRDLKFYNIATLKLKSIIKLLQEPFQIQFMSSIQKVIFIKDKQLTICDIDYQNNQLINCQQFSNYRIADLYLNQQKNFIILRTQDQQQQIVILDQHFVEIKCLHWNLQQVNLVSIHTSDDMKYLYKNVKSTLQGFQIFQLCLID